MDQILDIVASKFEERDISIDVILPNIKLLDSYSRQSPAFNDPRYLPFYYRFGCQVRPKKVLQIGSKIGLVAASFLKGCKTVDEWFVIDELNSCLNIVESNIKLNGCKKINFRFLDKNPIIDSEEFEFFADMAIISEKFDAKKLMEYMEFAWSSLKTDCFLIVDYVKEKELNETFVSFFNIKNRKPFLFNTRYGVGVLTRW